MRIVALLLLAFSTLIIMQANAQSEDAAPTMSLVYSSTWAPMSVGDDEKVRGIIPDLLEEIIQNRMGIKVRHIGLPWARAQTFIEYGGADGFVTTPTEPRLKYSIQSKENALPIPFHAFVGKNSPTEIQLRAGTPLEKLQSARYCDVLGNGWATAFYKKRNIDYEIAQSLENCLKMLASNRIEVVVHAAPVTQFAITKLSLNDQITMMPHAYSESPDFPLLISKRSNFGQDFLDKFDAVLIEMKKNHELEILLERLTQKNLASF